MYRVHVLGFALVALSACSSTVDHDSASAGDGGSGGEAPTASSASSSSGSSSSSSATSSSSAGGAGGAGGSAPPECPEGEPCRFDVSGAPHGTCDATGSCVLWNCTEPGESLCDVDDRGFPHGECVDGDCIPL